jgi:hypothetical protein
MDMRKYSGSVFRKVEDPDLREGPVQVVITAVSEGKFEKPVLDLDDNTLLSLNSTNNRTLAKAYGFDSDNWIGKTIELTLGEVEFNDKMQVSILVKPISPPIGNKPPKPNRDDSAPF